MKLEGEAQSVGTGFKLNKVKLQGVVGSLSISFKNEEFVELMNLKDIFLNQCSFG